MVNAKERFLQPASFDDQGDQYVFTWTDTPTPVRFRVEQLRETSTGIWAEIWAESANAIQLNGKAKHVHFHHARLNLASTSGKEDFVKALRRLDDRSENNRFWQQMVEQVCARSLEAYRQGEPVIDLSTVEVPAHIEYLLKPCLPLYETTLFSADGGSGKSWMAIICAVAVQCGLALPGDLSVERQVRALYLDWETGPTEIARRLRMVSRGFHLPKPPPILYREMHRPLVEDARTIREIIRDCNIGLVIVDSLGPATGASLVDDEPANQIMAALRSFRKTTRLVLAHVSKEAAKQKEGRGRTYGNVFFENLARSVFEIRSEDFATHPWGSETALGLFHTKVNIGRYHPEIGLRLVIDDDGQSVFLQEQAIHELPTIAQRLTLRKRVLLVLRKGEADIPTLVKATDASENALRMELSRMYKRGEVVKREFVPPGGSRSQTLWGLKADESF